MNLNRVISNVYDNRRGVKTRMHSFLSVSSRRDIILKVVATQRFLTNVVMNALLLPFHWLNT